MNNINIGVEKHEKFENYPISGYRCMDCGEGLRFVGTGEFVQTYYCPKCEKKWYKKGKLNIYWMKEDD